MLSSAQWSCWICRGAGFLFLVFFGLSAGGCDRAHSMAGDAVYEIDVPDIVCQGCAATLGEALRGVAGVEDVRVDVAAKRVRIGVDSTEIEGDMVLREAIIAAGYAPADRLE